MYSFKSLKKIVVFLKFVFVLFSSDAINASELDDHPRRQVTTENNNHRLCYQNGMENIGVINNIDSWDEIVRRLARYGWRVKGADHFYHEQSEWRVDVDGEKLKQILLGTCSAVLNIATGIGGADAIVGVVQEVVKCFSAALTNDGNSNTLRFTNSNGKGRAVKHGFIENQNCRYIAGYFLSFERMRAAAETPVHNGESIAVNCNGNVTFFEIIPPSPERLTLTAPAPTAPVDLYRNLPDGCTTNIYTAMIDNRYKKLSRLDWSEPNEGHGGWCQIIDTRDSAGDVVYTMMHFLRHAPKQGESGYGVWSTQEAFAEIEVVIGRKYEALALLPEMAEQKTSEFNLCRKPILFRNSRDPRSPGEVINRHERWLKMALIGMQMDNPLSPDQIVRTVEDIIRNPIRGDTQRLRYGIYGSSIVSSKVINCIPWPFLFWERILGRRVCNSSMGEYLDFKVWFSSCKIQHGFEAFFENNSLVEPKMKLVQIQETESRIHRVWTVSGRERNGGSGTDFIGGHEIAYKDSYWVQKHRGGLIQIMDINYKESTCFLA